jgi:DNA-directed RNA polymerase subunit omega
VARVTVEDCLEKVGNRFALVILAAERARMLARRSRPLVECENKYAVTALREIAGGHVRFIENIRDHVELHLEEMRLRGIKPPTDLKPSAPAAPSGGAATAE